MVGVCGATFLFVVVVVVPVVGVGALSGFFVQAVVVVGAPCVLCHLLEHHWQLVCRWSSSAWVPDGPPVPHCAGSLPS